MQENHGTHRGKCSESWAFIPRVTGHLCPERGSPLPASGLEGTQAVNSGPALPSLQPALSKGLVEAVGTEACIRTSPSPDKAHGLCTSTFWSFAEQAALNTSVRGVDKGPFRAPVRPPLPPPQAQKPSEVPPGTGCRGPAAQSLPKPRGTRPGPTCTFRGPIFFTRGGWHGSRTTKSCFLREAALTSLKASTWTVNSPSLEGPQRTE